MAELLSEELSSIEWVRAITIVFVIIPSALSIAVRLVSTAGLVVSGIEADPFESTETGVLWNEFSSSGPHAVAHGTSLLVRDVKASWSLLSPVFSGRWMAEVVLEQFTVVELGIVGNILTSSPSALVSMPVVSTLLLVSS
jgi:hypothetical protein